MTVLRKKCGGKDAEPVLITGGAGFIGSNLADRLLSEGERVIIYDNLSRCGSEKNLEWLKSRHRGNLHCVIADLADLKVISNAVSRARLVFHFAAQVAVTTSVEDPLGDFEANIRGTLNVLEAVRSQDAPPGVIYTSTNKVYGSLDDLALSRNGTRYEPVDGDFGGIGETRPLKFHSPYGCSKGAADQYVLDYSRIYGLETTVFRMSCIYGPRQFGTEDQGWVAHFLIRSIRGEPIKIFGSGMQVRDILYIDDLVDAFLLASRLMPRIRGEAFNIGGGPSNTLSLIELINLIGELSGAKPVISSSGWRPGDQRYYASDTGKFRAATGWSPKVGVRNGIGTLHGWLLKNHAVARRMLPAAEKASV